jgi:arsenate reductase (thioredoxin)
VHPLALRLLHELQLPTEGLRSKSWNEFSKPGAPVLNFVFTVCDNAAGEVCPIWPGQPISAHWGVNDPAAVEGSEAVQLAAFHKAFRELEARIKSFCSISVASLDRMRLKERLDEIGRGDTSSDQS